METPGREARRRGSRRLSASTACAGSSTKIGPVDRLPRRPLSTSTPSRLIRRTTIDGGSASPRREFSILPSSQRHQSYRSNRPLRIVIASLYREFHNGEMMLWAPPRPIRRTITILSNFNLRLSRADASRTFADHCQSTTIWREKPAIIRQMPKSGDNPSISQKFGYSQRRGYAGFSPSCISRITLGILWPDEVRRDDWVSSRVSSDGECSGFWLS